MVRKNVCLNFESALKLSVTKKSFSTATSGIDLVRTEAFNLCYDRSWSSFLCLLSLDTVIKRQVQSLYPDSGLAKYKYFFNTLILPSKGPASFETVNILFCFEGVLNNATFLPNHYVPFLILQLYAITYGLAHVVSDYFVIMFLI